VAQRSDRLGQVHKYESPDHGIDRLVQSDVVNRALLKLDLPCSQLCGAGTGELDNMCGVYSDDRPGWFDEPRRRNGDITGAAADVEHPHAGLYTSDVAGPRLKVPLLIHSISAALTVACGPAQG
jgi:hypothetical protein